MLNSPTATASLRSSLVRLLRWDKPAGRWILVLPALWSLVLASRGQPSWVLVAIVVAGGWATSAAGCVINDLWDRDIDPQVERTRTRPLAARQLPVAWAIALLALAGLASAGLALFLKPLSLGLCGLALPVIAVYPLAKRRFVLPQLVLAIAWGFAVLIPWSAVAGLDWPAWLLWGAVVLWTLGFDTVYALADREDDRRIGIHSSALFFGRYVALAIGGFYGGAALLLAHVAWALVLGWPFWLAWAVAVGLWGRQVRRLAQAESSGVSLSRLAYGRMFGENVTVAIVLLGGMWLGCWLGAG